MEQDQIEAVVDDVTRTLGSVRELWTKIADRAEPLPQVPALVSELALDRAMRANDHLARVGAYRDHDEECNRLAFLEIAEWVMHTTSVAVEICMALGSVERTR